MTYFRFFFLSIPFFVLPIASYFTAWFIFADPRYILAVSTGTYLLFVYFYWSKSKSILIGKTQDKILTLTLIFFFIAMFALYPVRNSNLGDGILLVENVFLESGLFGYQLTLDELLEAFLHSAVFSIFSDQLTDPRTVYRIFSTSAGIIFLAVLFGFSRIKNLNFFSMLVIFSSGGMLLFFGYSENYSLTTLLILFFLIVSVQKISKGKKNMGLLTLPTILASFAILFHLVSGYLIFPLIYLWYIASDKGEYFKNALLSTLIGIVVISPFFIYFIFFSDPRADMSQTHIAHPPFYPLSRMISTKHFLEILSCIFFTCFPSFFLLLDALIFKKRELITLEKDKEFIFLFVALGGFLVHAFTFHPLLGFPSDWDIMSFYWLPFALVATYIFGNENSQRNQFLPMLILSFLMLMGNMAYLNKPVEEKEMELAATLNLANQFLRIEKETIRKMNPKIKKFYFKTQFFLFKAQNNLKKMKNEKLLSDAKNYREELDKNITELNPQWQKDYIRRLTEFHTEYLKLVKNQ